MKLLLLTLFVAAVISAPVPDSGTVEIIVNGLPEGAPLQTSYLVDSKLNSYVDGAVLSHNLQHPHTAASKAEAAVAAAVPNKEVNVVNNDVPPSLAVPKVIAPQPVVLPSPADPEVIVPKPLAENIAPQPVILPSPIVPEVNVPYPVLIPSPDVSEVIVPQPVVLPSPAVIFAQPVVMASPATPESIAPTPVLQPTVPELDVESEELPDPAPHYASEMYNDGIAQVQLDSPDEPSILGTLQAWLNMAYNYIKNAATEKSDEES